MVDDEPDMGELRRIMLTADGHAVGGQSALAHLAAGAAYDLVVCDLHMLEVNGVAVYRALGQLVSTGPAVQFMEQVPLSRALHGERTRGMDCEGGSAPGVKS